MTNGRNRTSRARSLANHPDLQPRTCALQRVRAVAISAGVLPARNARVVSRYAALRPYLYVHKGVTQGFLDLFRMYFNLRTRRWGRHKGTSAHECVTGERVEDWLTALGYPPAAALS